jgi:ABC-type multidrug transport system fused ATPase/permease subunit
LRGIETAETVRIAVDGKERESLKVLSGTTTLIPQHPEIFDQTVEYNVTVGIPTDEKDVEAACDMACFTSVVEQLPSGLKTQIRERGGNLSGGEKQRLALARGVFAAKDATILLLDEPTSSMDPWNETNVYRNFFDRFEDKCIISSVHRLQLLPMFDYIYVLERGRVAEEGTLPQLLAREGVLRKLWEHTGESSVGAVFSRTLQLH